MLIQNLTLDVTEINRIFFKINIISVRKNKFLFRLNIHLGDIIYNITNGIENTFFCIIN